jgi:hypothetical protein
MFFEKIIEYDAITELLQVWNVDHDGLRTLGTITLGNFR